MDQAASLRQRFQSRSSSYKDQEKRKEAKAVAVVSGKGGVGKSNFSLNFSISLSQKGYRVLLVDMDLGMGNIDILMGDSPNITLYDFLNSKAEIHELIFKGPANISYLAAGSAFQSIKKLEGEKLGQFIRTMEQLSAYYDYLIFDMGAGATEESISFLFSVDDCFVITTPEPTAITDAYSMTKHLIINQAPASLYLLCNRAKSSQVGQGTLLKLQRTIEKFLHKQVQLLGIIPEDESVQNAVISQTPFILYRPAAKSSIAIGQISERYVSAQYSNIGAEYLQKQPGFLHKLRSFFSERKGHT
ncbi:MAG TPA: MinD/ParA family protein [Bacillus sp. (in: firmicutes)]|uniref:MinD/ParA family protein n=1 Tax=Bacillus litorisediminis TaxID=2922713 RepID=UPI001FAD4442|nr:MinD/ParA family protein [Bacillus litorisediminis]HWO77974.1 MinD/ParA family protein [Bacillus sp. (in: firmicutes)]